MTVELGNLQWQAFRLSKRGNSAAEYEDAYAVEPAAGRFAVADGASEASFAGLWARDLVEGFVAASGKSWRNLDWLPEPRRRWAEEVDALALPWYAEDKRDQGAFATFLGLGLFALGPAQAGRWTALAVGDTCLFHTRGDRFLTSFPLTESAAFDNQPCLLGSRPPLVDVAWEQAQGRWQPRDRFLLMTDALAQWFLDQTEQGHAPLEAIARLLSEADPQDAFAGWVEERRDKEGLRNDDVTLLVIDTPDESSAPGASA
jgi:serine/threonine protein phosphatase PrpC